MMLMEWEQWQNLYRAIKRDIELNWSGDERSSMNLSRLLKNNRRIAECTSTEKRLKELIEGKKVYVMGAGPDLGLELDRLEEECQREGKSLKMGEREEVIISADGATTELLRRGITPDIVVTDLDGVIEDILAANEEGSIIVVHSHGDNISKLKEVVPRFRGMVLGTTQVDPSNYEGLYNFGGFTDGDRSAFLAHHYGADKIVLLGFNFNEVGEKIGDRSAFSEEVKFKKLAWSNLLLGFIPSSVLRFYSERWDHPELDELFL